MGMILDLKHLFLGFIKFNMLYSTSCWSKVFLLESHPPHWVATRKEAKGDQMQQMACAQIK